MNTMSQLALGLGAAFLIGAPAMAALDQGIQADIPFSFVVGKTTLPAGKYIVEPEDSDDPGALVVRSSDNKYRIVVQFEGSDARVAPDNAELVFDVVDGKYILCQVWQAGSMEGNLLPRSAAERPLEKTRSPGHGHRSVKAQTVKTVTKG